MQWSHLLIRTNLETAVPSSRHGDLRFPLMHLILQSYSTHIPTPGHCSAVVGQACQECSSLVQDKYAMDLTVLNGNLTSLKCHSCVSVPSHFGKFCMYRTSKAAPFASPYACAAAPTLVLVLRSGNALLTHSV